MSFFSWLRNPNSGSAPGRANTPRRRTSRRLPARSYRPRFETLEDRVVLSTFNVTTDVDGVAGSLRAAVIAANASAGADTIVLPAGNYLLTLAGANEDLAATGDLDITDDVTIVGAGAGATVIDGGGLDRVFYLLDAKQAEISGVTIQGGVASFGGGIYTRGTLTIIDSTLSRNSATGTGGGGGILNDNGGILMVSGSTLSGNSAKQLGGGIRNFSGGTLTVSGSTLSGNSALSGGGIYNDFGSTATVIGSHLSGNSANGNSFSGGGVYNNGTLTVTGSTLDRNSAVYHGGGIYNRTGPTLTVSDSTLLGNSAKTGGGIDNRGTLKVSGSTLSGNSAGVGGGIYNFNRTATLTGSTLSGNSATDLGGGIFSFSGGTLTVSGSTLSGNSAKTEGGGIYNNSATVVVSSSIVAGNAGNSISPDLNSATTVTNSLIGDNSGILLVSGILLGEALVGTPDLNGNIVGGPMSGVIDPLLDPLGYNGGPTQTMLLLPGSPAIDMGSNPGSLATDQRGQPFARTFGSQTDMGAFELQPLMFTPTVSVSDGGGTFNGSPFPATATVAGVNGPFAAKLEGVSPTLTYYAGPAASGSALAGAPTNAGDYTVVAAFTGSAEYISSSVSTTFTIGKATISYAIGNGSHDYGSTANLAADLGATFLTGVNGENLVIAYSSTGNTGTANVGSYAIIGTVSDGTGLASNYTVTLTPGTLTVNTKAISYTIGDATHVYGSTVNLTATLGTTINTGVNHENLAITYASTGNTGTANVGSYAITGVVADGTGLASNYTVTLTPGTLAVTRATLTGDAITQDALNMAKQGMLTITVKNVAGLLNGDTLTTFLSTAQYYITVRANKYIFVPTTVTTSGSRITITYTLRNSALAAALAAELADNTSAATAVSAGFFMESMNYTFTDDYLTRLFSSAR